MELISVATAIKMILGHFSAVESEIIPIHVSRGRILSEDIIAPVPLPMFTNASMDGFAIQSSDLVRAAKDLPVELSIVADLPAGVSEGAVLKSGQAMRIMTGAPVPQGCDAVVPVEDTNITNWRDIQNLPSKVLVFRQIHRGEYLRYQGEDVKPGHIVLYKGTCLRAQEVGFLSAFGFSSLTVRRKPRIALLSTGDELLPVGVPLTPGHIFDSNYYSLSSLVDENGGEVIQLGIAADQKQTIKQCLDLAITSRADLIVSSAGVSVGAFDFVRHVVEDHGALSFWRVNIRPGKPLTFGHYRGIPFMGLPGNPVSAFVGFEVFVLPAIQKMKGINNWIHPAQIVRLIEPIFSDGRESYLRAIITKEGNELKARLAGHQGSGNLKSLVDANAFLIVPSEVKSLPIGAEIFAWINGEIRNKDNLEK